ncbi:MAG: hypothetical protein MJ202_06265, partial [Lentisphaeria bacterium]|nr:hypothetical protein [Lentisphaeria bacterium]
MNLRIISGIIAETPAIPRIFFFETLVASRFLQNIVSWVVSGGWVSSAGKRLPPGTGMFSMEHG